MYSDWSPLQSLHWSLLAIQYMRTLTDTSITVQRGEQAVGDTHTRTRTRCVEKYQGCLQTQRGGCGETTEVCQTLSVKCGDIQIFWEGCEANNTSKTWFGSFSAEKSKHRQWCCPDPDGHCTSGPTSGCTYEVSTGGELIVLQVWCFRQEENDYYFIFIPLIMSIKYNKPRVQNKYHLQ